MMASHLSEKAGHQGEVQRVAKLHTDVSVKTKAAGEAQTQGIPITYDDLFNLTAVTNTLYPCLTDDVLCVLLRFQNTQNCVGYYVVVRIPFYIGEDI